MSYLALDLGAGSGRAIVGTIENNKIILDEVHRFANEPIQMGDTLYWNLLSLFSNIQEGIRLAASKGYKIEGIAVDTWGVDFALVDNSGKILSNPVCYRDLRTEGLSDTSSTIISKSELYADTGIQQMDINTIFQLLSLSQSQDSTYKIADKLLFTPDLINYLLTGVVCNEYTIASTSQLLNAQTRQWESAIFKKLSINEKLMQKIVHPGTLIGKLKKDIGIKVGIENVNVYAVGSHDTASAIAAIPAKGKDWGFLSSGTWSLLGVLRDEPILTDKAIQNDFTNEGGVDHKILFMRNITGLWLLQRLIVEWKAEGLNCDYNHILHEGEKEQLFQSIVNSDDSSFTHPISMTKAIQEYCEKTNQTIPKTQGELTCCVLQSLAIKYHFVQSKLNECCDNNNAIKKLFIVGGGSQNKLLNQYIANALHVEVIVGLTEGTAIGNIMQQAIASQEIADWTEAHKIINNSFDFHSYHPQDVKEWQEATMKFKHLF